MFKNFKVALMTKSIFAVLIASVGLASCVDDLERADTHLNPIYLTEETRGVADQGNDFGFKFTKTYMESCPSDNFAISPLSLVCGLTMLANAADDQTTDEILSAMGFQQGDSSLELLNTFCNSILTQFPTVDRTTDCLLANAIFYDPSITIKDDFRAAMENQLDVHLSGESPRGEKGKSMINKWVSSATRKMIPEFLSNPIDNPFVMINALYFKGIWKNPFSKGATRSAAFHNIDGITSETPFMNQVEHFYYNSRDKFQIVKLPYGNGNFSMTLILPDPDVSLPEVMADITAESFRDLQWDGKNSLVTDRKSVV